MRNEMETSQIILMDGSSFLMEMISVAIAREPGLEVVAEAKGMDDFLREKQQVEADWTCLLIAPGERIPATLKEIIREDGTMRLMVIFTDGSKVMVQGLEQPLRILDARNLSDVLTVLHHRVSADG